VEAEGTCSISVATCFLGTWSSCSCTSTGRQHMRGLRYLTRPCAAATTPVRTRLPRAAPRTPHSSARVQVLPGTRSNAARLEKPGARLQALAR